MLNKQIYNDSSLSSLFAVINEEVSFKGIGIRISGTAGATPPVVGDVGRIQYIKNGITIVDVNFDALLCMDDLLYGLPNRESTASGIVDMFAYIPRRYLDNNVEHVVPADNAQLKCTFGANLATRIASGGLVEVYLDMERGTQKYDMVLRQYSDSIAGASTRPFAVDQPNIMYVQLSATVSAVYTLVGSNITRVNLEIGGMSGDASIGMLQDNTSLQLNVEDITATAANAPYALACVPYLANGDISSRLYDNLRISTTTSGASNPELLVMSALFNEDRYQDSLNKQRSRNVQIAGAKAARGDKSTLAVLQTSQAAE